MNSIELLQKDFARHINSLFPDAQLSSEQIRLELNVDESKQAFGDMSTNIAMILAKKVGKSPRVIAELLYSFTHPYIKDITIAGPGFINVYLTDEALRAVAQEIFSQKESFFKPTTLSVYYKYCLEFVSANPTGPLHFGHGRGGIIGDVLGNILHFVGHTVSKEFYINDAGNQIKKLGESFKIRCMQAAGFEAIIPEDGYHGDYLLDVAQECFKRYGNDLADKPEEFFVDYAKNILLDRIQNTLQQYGITYNIWFSEKTLHDNHEIEKALDILNEHGFLFEQEGALWFRTSHFGDDKDRVVRKSTGEYTYIAADIAYLKNKIDRGFNNLIFILGHDHHSYVSRLNAVKNGLGFVNVPLDVILYQLVKITQNGALVRMSKRAGAIITLQDIIDTVGSDVARFFYLNRKADAQLEFDLELALKKTDENPVYYIQYAYVRTGSILEKAYLIDELQNIGSSDSCLLGQEEALLLKKISVLRDLLYDITHLLTYYILELAQIFHRYYSRTRIIDLKEIPKSRSRLLLIIIVRDTIGLVLHLLRVNKPDKM